MRTDKLQDTLIAECKDNAKELIRATESMSVHRNPHQDSVSLTWLNRRDGQGTLIIFTSNKIPQE